MFKKLADMAVQLRLASVMLNEGCTYNSYWSDSRKGLWTSSLVEIELWVVA